LLISVETPEACTIVYYGKITDTQKCQNQAIIKFCCNLGMKPTKTFVTISRRIENIKFHDHKSFKWLKQFSDGHYFERQ
jgi:hypothetical protein